MGVKVEMEHVMIEAKEITLDHLSEFQIIIVVR
jgi:hypothetical protein